MRKNKLICDFLSELHVSAMVADHDSEEVSARLKIVRMIEGTGLSGSSRDARRSRERLTMSLTNYVRKTQSQIG